MNVTIIKGIIEVLKDKKSFKLAHLLEKSFEEINESNSFGNQLYSCLCTLEIYSPLENHIELSKLTKEEKDKILEAAKVIMPPRPEAPEIVNITFLPIYEIENPDSYLSFIESLNLSKFWNGFKAVIDEFLFSKGYFKEFSTRYNGREFEIDECIINSKMLQEIGEALYPFKKQPSNNTVLELIKFFFKFAWTPDWDRGTATYQYTVNINKLFDNFNLPLKLKKGEIVRKNSIILDQILDFDHINLIKNDPILAKLLNESIESFIRIDRFNIDTALEKISNALERVKTVLNPKNKKSSIQDTIDSITSDQTIRDLIGEHTKKLTEISNNYNIRHKEKNQSELESEALKRYFFYEYFNLIRLILDAIEKNNQP